MLPVPAASLTTNPCLLRPFKFIGKAWEKHVNVHFKIQDSRNAMNDFVHGSSTTVPRCPQPARGASVAWGRPWLLLHNLSVSSAKSFTGPGNGDPRKKSGTSGSPQNRFLMVSP